jgi:magnesium-transporting ATPase (P-type)
LALPHLHRDLALPHLHRDWAQPFRAGLSLAVAAIPEGLPIILTITLAFGMKARNKTYSIPSWRTIIAHFAHHKFLTQRAIAPYFTYHSS